MLLNFLWRTASLIWWLFLYAKIYQFAKPSSYRANNPVQAKHVRYIPLQMVSLTHAALTLAYGVGYVVGLWGEQSIWEARIASTAYLFFDMFESWRLYYEKQRHESKTQERGLTSLNYATGGGGMSGKKAAAIVNHDPMIKSFHHICTLMFMFGVFFKSDIAGCVLFFVGEMPVLFLNISKSFSYMGMDGHTLAMMCTWLGIVSYACCRIILFPLVFIVVILPTMNVFNIFAWSFLGCLILVYVLNVITFACLLDDRKGSLPISMKQMAEISIQVLGLMVLFAAQRMPPKKVHNACTDEEEEKEKV